jgi:hypothetical protein
MKIIRDWVTVSGTKDGNTTWLYSGNWAGANAMWDSLLTNSPAVYDRINMGAWRMWEDDQIEYCGVDQRFK